MTVCCTFCSLNLLFAMILMFVFLLFQLAELEARLLEAESRADEAEDKVSAKNVYFFPHNPLVFFLCAVNIWCDAKERLASDNFLLSLQRRLLGLVLVVMLQPGA
jgi:hypothetical protein